MIYIISSTPLTLNQSIADFLMYLGSLYCWTLSNISTFVFQFTPLPIKGIGQNLLYEELSPTMTFVPPCLMVFVVYRTFSLWWSPKICFLDSVHNMFSHLSVAYVIKFFFKMYACHNMLLC